MIKEEDAITGFWVLDGDKLPHDGRNIVLNQPMSFSNDVNLFNCFRVSRNFLDACNALTFYNHKVVWRLKVWGDLKRCDFFVLARHAIFLHRFEDDDFFFQYARKIALSVASMSATPESVVNYLKTGNAELREEAFAKSQALSFGYPSHDAARSCIRAACASEHPIDTIANVIFDAARAKAWHEYIPDRGPIANPSKAPESYKDSKFEDRRRYFFFCWDELGQEVHDALLLETKKDNQR